MPFIMRQCRWREQGISNTSLKQKIARVDTVEINKDQPNKNKQRLFIQSLLEQESKPPLLMFWQKLKGLQRSEKAS